MDDVCIIELIADDSLVNIVNQSDGSSVNIDDAVYRKVVKADSAAAVVHLDANHAGWKDNFCVMFMKCKNA